MTTPAPIAKAKLFSNVLVVLRRLHHVAEKLQSGDWVSAAQFAAEWETCTKTVYRTIEFLRSELLWDIESGAKGFRLIKKGKALIT